MKGLLGVSFNTSYNSWDSYIGIEGKSVFLGRFDNVFDAACKRKSEENKNKKYKGCDGNPIHGRRNSPEYSVWQGMMS